MNNKAYEKITEQILAELEKGNIPWKKPWKSFGSPKNLITDKPYTGINFFLLSTTQYSSNYFLTFKQAKALKGYVKKGEKSIPITYWGSAKSKKEEDEGKAYKFLKTYNVFNIEQCENLDHSRIKDALKIEELDFNPIEKAEEIVNGYIGKPEIMSIENRAYYIPLTDKINMPKKEHFNGVPEYYSTLFHELTHSTGHEKRLARPEIVETNYHGSHEYSKEELTAELGAAYLCAVSGIDNTIENSSAYIKSWLKVLKSKDNAKWVVQASTKAQRAANYILGDIKKK